MTAKSQTGFSPRLLGNHAYSGTLSTLLYNWPIFCGVFLFGLLALLLGVFAPGWWQRILLLSGGVAWLLLLNILVAAFIVYDWGNQREYDRLADLGNLAEANMIIDITAGKLRGTRGLLKRLKQGHYFVIDIYDAPRMPDNALRRAREMEPPLEAGRRIYRRSGRPDSLPIPHNWANAVVCSFSLHELQEASDRQALFAEFARILKPGGKLLIAEHGRDWQNLLVFGPGVISFRTPESWQQHITQAGFTIQQHERWRGLVHLWLAER